VLFGVDCPNKKGLCSLNGRIPVPLRMIISLHLVLGGMKDHLSRHWLDPNGVLLKHAVNRGWRVHRPHHKRFAHNSGVQAVDKARCRASGLITLLVCIRPQTNLIGVFPCVLSDRTYMGHRYHTIMCQQAHSRRDLY
jgi:hypothetical protein